MNAPTHHPNAKTDDACHPARDLPKKEDEEKTATLEKEKNKTKTAEASGTSHFFKTYDCRGKYGIDATEQNCFRLAAACNAFKRPIVVGMDYREHNDSLASAFFQGFQGDAWYAGHLPSPALAYNSQHGWAVSFTASHNPAGYNGVKFKKHKRCFFENELQQLKKWYDFSKPPEKIDFKPLPFEDTAVKRNYLDDLPEIQNGLFDLGGGAACALKDAFPRRLFDVPDPRFERHASEPKEGTLDVLQAETRKQNQAGFAFDGDADRCIAVDQGRVIDGGILAAFIAARHVPAKSKIFVTLDTQAEVFRFLQDEGFRTAYTPVGDVHVVKAMLEHGAAFAAERSGHYSFQKHMPDSDGIYTAALLSGTKAGELVEFASQFKAVSLKEEVRFQVDFGQLKDWAETKAGSGNVESIDGVKADFGEYAFLVRASQTEPKIRINVEAASSEKAKKGMDEVKAAMEKCRNG